VTGTAILHIGGQVYVCSHAEYDGAACTFTGQLRITDVNGPRLYEAKTMKVPISKIEEIEWTS
jgi:hypothetical protein